MWRKRSIVVADIHYVKPIVSNQVVWQGQSIFSCVPGMSESYV